MQSWHVHTNPGFIILLGGDHHDHWRHERFEQKALSLIYHPTSEPHAGEIGPRGMVGLNVELDAGWLHGLALRERELGAWQLLDSPHWRLRALRMLALTRKTDEKAGIDGETLATELLEPVLQMSRATEKSAGPRWLARVEEYIQASFRGDVTLRMVAQEADVHAVYLARVFRQRHGCSVSEYIRVLRLVEAGELILQKKHSLAEAAAAAGFYDQAHLARWFAREFGFAPRVLKSTRDLLEVDRN